MPRPRRTSADATVLVPPAPVPPIEPDHGKVLTMPRSSPAKRPNPEVMRFAAEDMGILSAFARCFDDPSWDLPSAINVALHPHSPARVRTGIHIALPVGTVGLVLSRHSTFEERGILVPALMFPAGFRGELTIPVRNMTRQRLTIRKGERVAQLIVLPVVIPQTLFTEVGDLPEDGLRGYSGGASGR